MKRLFALGAALMLMASVSGAQSIGLYPGSDCSSGAALGVNNACTSGAGTAFSIVGTCVVPSRGKNQFVGEISMVDVQTSLPTIPDWWRADACRSTGFSLTTDASLAGGSNCPTSLWDNVAPAGNNITATVANVSGRIRFYLGAVLYPYDVYNLSGDGSSELIVFKLSVLRARSSGPGACSGCTQGACIVLSEVQIQGQADAGDSDYLHLTTPISGHGYVTYNSGVSVCAGATPPENRTWGSLKALYR